jgi:O-antigen/teichoic acid export membrane protein
VIKNLSVYALVSLVSAAILFLTTVYLTRLLNPSEFAFIGIFGAIFYLLTPLIQFNSLSLVGINAIKLSNKKYQNFINNYISVSILISLFTLPIILVMMFLFMEYKDLILLTFFVSISTVLISIHNIELIQSKNVNFFALYRVSLVLVNLIFVFLFVDILNMSWEGRLYGLIFSNMLIIFLMKRMSFQSLDSFRYNIDYDYIKEHINFGWPLMVGLGAAWGITQLDKFIVVNFFDISSLGYYSLGYMIGMSFVVINQALVQSLMPKVYLFLESGVGRKDIYKYAYLYNIFILIAVLFAMLIMYNFSDIILGEAYRDSLDIIFLVMIAVAFDGMYRVYGLIINFYKENILRTKIEYTVLIINILISIFLIPYYGILAPAMGTITAYLLAYVLTKHYAIKLLNLHDIT